MSTTPDPGFLNAEPVEPPPFPARGHDHRRCQERILAEAERRCAERGVRLTPQRRRVLDIVAGSHSALGAYEILDRMAQDGRRPAPIAVYRALEFLVRHGLVHRLATVNAFVACSRPDGGGHGVQFLICRGCGTVAEIGSRGIEAAIADWARATGFDVAEPVVEIAGVCSGCRRGGDAGPS